ncbi:MAG: energy-coupled thiamine transporter ThiT [Oscillospiraceae bacterium]|nr:energy-coupled thiamine transporter ThiT [Oscillospiraceae bacterium]
MEQKSKNTEQKRKKLNIARLTESAMMIAIATLLSMAKLLDMPYGGSVTLASMLPLVILAYRHGLGWGVLSGLAYGAVQLALGSENIGYLPVKDFASVATLILADYLLAFAVLGLGGIFRKVCKRQATALAFGSVLVAVLRYACHVAAGWTVWAQFSLTKAGLLYSLSYNATYMLPEMLILVVAAIFLGNALDFRADSLRPMPREEKSSVSSGLLMSALALISFALSFDVVQIFSKLQDADTGAFSSAGLKEVNWLLVIVLTAVCFAAAIGLLIVRRNGKRAEKEEKKQQKEQ